MSRGNRREAIFEDDQDRRRFLVTLGEACEKTGWKVQEAAEQRIKRIVQEELKSLGWKSAELGRRLKGDPEKIRIARRLRTEMTVTLKWMAVCLVMGTWTYVANRLYHG